MGAFSAAALWEKRKIEKEEAIRLAAFGGNAGAAFLFGTTSALFECPNAGALLFAAQTASSLLVGLFLASRQKKKGALNPSHPFVAEKVPLLPLAADCVVKSGLAMLSVTAFVVFFAVITAALGEIAVLAPLLPFFSAFLETSTAVKSASALVGAYGLRPMLTLAAFSVGFTGLSVFLQAESLFHGELPLSYLVKVRLAIALLSAAITFLFCPLL